MKYLTAIVIEPDPTAPSGYRGKKFHHIPGNDEAKKEKFIRWVKNYHIRATHINFYKPSATKRTRGEYIGRTYLKI
jgi:erythromycin esterase-like protein